MQQGKVSHNVLKRSVLKYITPRRSEVLWGAGMGNDNSAISIREDGVFVLSTNPVNMVGEEGMYHCFFRCRNDLAVANAQALGVTATILLPQTASEEQLQRSMSQLAALCEQHQMQIVGGHTAIASYISQPVISLTMMGLAEAGGSTKALAGQDLVLTKYIALEGSGLLARQKKQELCQHYTLSFVERAEQFLQELSIVPEAALLAQRGVTAMHNVSEGGILAALWEFMEHSGSGMEVELRAIPIRQETVELCEFYHLNPYQLMSNGSLLFAADDGEGCVRMLQSQGIAATVIGRVTEGRQRILRNEEEQRFLDRPKPDELFRLGIM